MIKSSDQPDQLDHLLATLAARDILLHAGGGRLHIDAPVGSFTPELQAQVKRQRDEIIRQLEAEQADGGPRWEDRIEPPEPCPRCDGLLCWWDLYGGRHCLHCNPPVNARRLAADAARIRQQTTPTNRTKDACCKNK